MSTPSITGPAAMPRRYSESAPFFSNRSNELIEDFLYEFDLLATRYDLSDKEKVETVVRYVPYRMRDLWQCLDGYDSGNWLEFRSTLVELYPDRVTPRYTEQDLIDLVDRSCRTRLQHEADVVQYYRDFLIISHQLRTADRITEHVCNVEFFCGFHPDHADVLLSRLFVLKPEHPAHKPYDIRDVFIVARDYLIRTQVYSDRWIPRSSMQEGHVHDGQEHQDDPPRHDHDRLSNEPEMREPEPSMADDDMAKLAEIIRKLYRLSVRDVEYAVLWAQCKHRFPNVAQELARPEMFRAASDQVLAPQLPSQPTTPPPLGQPAAPISRTWAQRSSPTGVSDEATSFSTRADGCAFCALPGHLVRRCPSVDKYVRTGRATIIRGRIYLPGGGPIPNDGSGRGLKHALDTWLAANSPSSSVTSTVVQQISPSAASRNPEYSAPLREIDVRINDRLTGPGVVTQDAQVVAIGTDLAREVGATIHETPRVGMRGQPGRQC